MKLKLLSIFVVGLMSAFQSSANTANLFTCMDKTTFTQDPQCVAKLIESNKANQKKQQDIYANANFIDTDKVMSLIQMKSQHSIVVTAFKDEASIKQ
ncbi:hypothetical protein [Catenovulum maritimum]|uniref:Soluble pyridine nucleotide transhydrogenase n=1 Tax=Catenovulum maritimum TaxID=1513271 RepID=A0A0J8GSI7_9ALTE|nr:hypothetical protein [Catenovulum maritimum]KMT65697.1 hypothetical protein XM47_08370 [Catenovulum maritimum]